MLLGPHPIVSELYSHFCVSIWTFPPTQKVTLCCQICDLVIIFSSIKNNLGKEKTNLGVFFIVFFGTKSIEIWYTWDLTSMVAMVSSSVKSEGSPHNAVLCRLEGIGQMEHMVGLCAAHLHLP